MWSLNIAAVISFKMFVNMLSIGVLFWDILVGNVIVGINPAARMLSKY